MSPLAVITGGSKGIGKAIIERFAQAGFHIATCSRKKEDLKALKQAIESRFGVSVYIQSADLSVRDDAARFVEFVQRIGLPVDVLVNNAGVFIPGQIHSEEAGLLEK